MKRQNGAEPDAAQPDVPDSGSSGSAADDTNESRGRARVRKGRGSGGRNEQRGEPTPPARREPPASKGLKYLFYCVWIVALPLALAVGSVRVLRPDPYAFNPPLLRRLVAEQQVPATIMFFTLFAWLLWRFRYVLPLAGVAGVLGRRDLPAALRSKYDDAAQLIAEARRILDSRLEEVRRALSKSERESIDNALQELDEVMNRATLDVEAFSQASEEAERLVARHLGRWRKGELREYLESIGVAVAVALVLRFFVIEAFKIPSSSMVPTLLVGDHIFVAKYAYGPLLPRSDTRLYDRLPPARGDVMVFKYPENKEQDFIKRVVALPGDTLETVDARPVINGWLAPHCYVGKLEQAPDANGHVYIEYLGDKAFMTMYNELLGEDKCDDSRECAGNQGCRAGICGTLQGPYKVAPGEVWVMGDNRNNSHDSRFWRGGMGGGVPFANIKGRAMFVWFSWDDKTRAPRLDRLFDQVMGAPTLPPPLSAELLGGLKRCVENRPPIAESTPPPPRQR